MCDVDISWPKDFPTLKELDAQLRCGICYDYLKTCMITNCSHNYCSKCIRSYLTYQTKCPICFEQTFDNNLRNNRSLDRIVTLFTGIRDDLILVIKNNAYFNSIKKKAEECNWDISSGSSNSLSKTSTSDNQDSLGHDLSTPHARKSVSTSENLKQDHLTPKAQNSVSHKSRNNSVNKNNNHNKSEKIGNAFRNLSSALDAVYDQSLPSTSTAFTSPVRTAASPQTRDVTPRKPVHIPDIFIPHKLKKIKEEVNMVSCPVCSVDIPEKNINKHLDLCLGGNRETRSNSTNKRKPLPKLVYSLLSIKDLRKKLKEHGLSIQGDKVALENRHQRFTVLYNSECDSLNPRPIAELVQQIESEEREERESATNQKTIRFVVNKKDEAAIEEARHQYLQKNKSSFDALIQSVKQRLQVKTQKTKTDIVRENVIICDSDSEEETVCPVKNSFRSKVQVLDSSDDSEEELPSLHTRIKAETNSRSRSSGDSEEDQTPRHIKVEGDLLNMDPSDVLETTLYEPREEQQEDRDSTPSPVFGFKKEDQDASPPKQISMKSHTVSSPAVNQEEMECGGDDSDSNDSTSLLNHFDDDVSFDQENTKMRDRETGIKVEIKEENLSQGKQHYSSDFDQLTTAPNSPEFTEQVPINRKRRRLQIEDLSCSDLDELSTKENTPIDDDDDISYINRQIDSQLDDPDFRLNTQELIVSSDESQEFVKTRRSTRKRKQQNVLLETVNSGQNGRTSKRKK